MCLLLVAYRIHPRYPLVVAANRDEFHQRPAAAADWWSGGRILAGRDLQAGGTWMGIGRQGRFASVTNFREPAGHGDGLRSRGLLVAEVLADPRGGEELLTDLAASAEAYNGLNLVFGDRHGLFSFSNRGNPPQHLGPGLYGLSNHLLETPWPKVTRAKDKLERYLASGQALALEPLFELMRDTTPAPDRDLPETGLGLEWERLLAPMFIVSPDYGTRASTAILVDQDGEVRFGERSYDPQGQAVDSREFRFHAS